MTRQDLLRWIQNAFAGNFLIRTCFIDSQAMTLGVHQLRHFARYLQAGVNRIAKIHEGHLSRDQTWCQKFLPYENRYLNLMNKYRAKESHIPTCMLHHGQLLEEMRVSLYAQMLGTRSKISYEIIERDWQNIQAILPSETD